MEYSRVPRTRASWKQVLRPGRKRAPVSMKLVANACPTSRVQPGWCGEREGLQTTMQCSGGANHENSRQEAVIVERDVFQRNGYVTLHLPSSSNVYVPETTPGPSSICLISQLINAIRLDTSYPPPVDVACPSLCQRRGRFGIDFRTVVVCSITAGLGSFGDAPGTHDFVWPEHWLV